MPERRSRRQSSRPASARVFHWLAGTWRTEGQLVGVPASPATRLVAVDRYEWLPDLPLLAHYVAGRLGRTSVASFEVWAYRRSRRAYTSTSFDAQGAPSTFTGHLRGRAWTIRGTRERFRGTFATDGRTLTGTWDQKAGRTWQPWLTITLRKVGA